MDAVLVGGGLPAGATVEISGEAGSGKTTLAEAVVFTVRHRGRAALWLSPQPPAAQAGCGCQIGDQVHANPDTAEAAFEMAAILLASGEVGVVVIDPVASLVPSADLLVPIGDENGALQARTITRGVRTLRPLLLRHRAVLVCVTHYTIRGNDRAAYRTTVGGRALKLAAVRLETSLRRMEPGTSAVVRVVRDVRGTARCPATGVDVDWDDGLVCYRAGLKVGER